MAELSQIVKAQGHDITELQTLIRELGARIEELEQASNADH